jgi:hypothetical protein
MYIAFCGIWMCVPEQYSFLPPGLIYIKVNTRKQVSMKSKQQSNMYTYVTVKRECAMSEEFILFGLEES